MNIEIIKSEKKFVPLKVSFKITSLEDLMEITQAIRSMKNTGNTSKAYIILKRYLDYGG